MAALNAAAVPIVYIAGGVLIGAIALLLGYRRRAAHQDWKERHALARSVDRLSIRALPGGGALSLQARF